MSYDISLFERQFLNQAVESGLGDWTEAPTIPEDTIQALITIAVAEGFKFVPIDPAFAAFMHQQGVVPAREYEIDTLTLLARMSVHRGQISFTIPFDPRAIASIDACSRIARKLAFEYGLGYHDLQADMQDL